MNQLGYIKSIRAPQKSVFIGNFSEKKCAEQSL